jgi:hypothetical protein
MNVYVIVGSSAGALIAGNPVETDEPEEIRQILSGYRPLAHRMAATVKVMEHHSMGKLPFDPPPRRFRL